MNETKTEWRDCADPDELAAAVAAGVEVLRMRGGGWVPSALTHRDDFAWFLTHGTRYQLPASWTWRPEPPAPDELRERLRLGIEDAVNDYADVVMDIMDAEVVRHAGWLAARLEEADAERTTLRHRLAETPPATDDPWSKEALSLLPVPPWPGAVLSGLTDEDGEPTWLALAPNVLGEAVRTCVDFPWFICGSDNAVTPYWVEVRAPRAVPEPETERVPVWEAMVGERTAISPDGTPMELSHGDVLLYTNNDGMGGFLMYDDAGHAKEKRPLVAPDGTVEVLKATP